MAHTEIRYRTAQARLSGTVPCRGKRHIFREAKVWTSWYSSSPYWPSPGCSCGFPGAWSGCGCPGGALPPARRGATGPPGGTPWTGGTPFPCSSSRRRTPARPFSAGGRQGPGELLPLPGPGQLCGRGIHPARDHHGGEVLLRPLPRGILLPPDHGGRESFTDIGYFEQAYADVFKWHFLTLDTPAENVTQLRILSGKELELGELVFLDENGDAIPPGLYRLRRRGRAPVRRAGHRPGGGHLSQRGLL